MKYLLTSAFVAVVLASGVQRGGAASGYQEVKDWPRLPAGVQLGEVAGVDIDDFDATSTDRHLPPRAASLRLYAG